MVVTESHNQCSRPVLTTLSTLNPGNKTLYLCAWKGFSLLHFKNVKDMVKCEIVPQESLHLNGSWQHRPQDDPALSRLKVKIGQHPDFDNNRLSLEVSDSITKLRVIIVSGNTTGWDHCCANIVLQIHKSLFKTL